MRIRAQTCLLGSQNLQRRRRWLRSRRGRGCEGLSAESQTCLVGSVYHLCRHCWLRRRHGRGCEGLSADEFRKFPTPSELRSLSAKTSRTRLFEFERRRRRWVQNLVFVFANHSSVSLRKHQGRGLLRELERGEGVPSGSGGREGLRGGCGVGFAATGRIHGGTWGREEGYCEVLRAGRDSAEGSG